MNKYGFVDVTAIVFSLGSIITLAWVAEQPNLAWVLVIVILFGFPFWGLQAVLKRDKRRALPVQYHNITNESAITGTVAWIGIVGAVIAMTVILYIQDVLGPGIVLICVAALVTSCRIAYLYSKLALPALRRTS